MAVSAHDVASYIIKQTGQLTAMKLEKLLYYCQAWSLVWDESPLFDERIEAWVNGPIVPDVYAVHRGSFLITDWPKGDASKLSEDQVATVESVLKYYGDKSAQWLSDLTHKEDPWRLAREGLQPNERGNKEITHASMHEYYSSL